VTISARVLARWVFPLLWQDTANVHRPLGASLGTAQVKVALPLLLVKTVGKLADFRFALTLREQADRGAVRTLTVNLPVLGVTVSRMVRFGARVAFAGPAASQGARSAVAPRAATRMERRDTRKPFAVGGRARTYSFGSITAQVWGRGLARRVLAIPSQLLGAGDKVTVMWPTSRGTMLSDWTP
jgi:hypothetical protein